jgi:hypothetical protein
VVQNFGIERELLILIKERGQLISRLKQFDELIKNMLKIPLDPCHPYLQRLKIEVPPVDKSKCLLKGNNQKDDQTQTAILLIDQRQYNRSLNFHQIRMRRDDLMQMDTVGEEFYQHLDEGQL